MAHHLVALVAPPLGGLAVLALARLMGFRRAAGGELVLGLVVFLIAIPSQSVIQALPLLPEILARGAEALEEFKDSPGSLLALSLWLGMVAGFVQTGFKYLFVKRRSLTEAFNVGMGFGLTEAFVIGILGYVGLVLVNTVSHQAVAHGLLTAWLQPALGGLAALERFSATLFHVGSTVILADFAHRGKGRVALLLIAVIHGLLDTTAAAYQLTGSAALLATAEVAALALGLGLYLVVFRKVVEERPPQREVEW